LGGVVRRSGGVAQRDGDAARLDGGPRVLVLASSCGGGQFDRSIGRSNE
jgi:hypothetical protein